MPRVTMHKYTRGPLLTTQRPADQGGYPLMPIMMPGSDDSNSACSSDLDDFSDAVRFIAGCAVLTEFDVHDRPPTTAEIWDMCLSLSLQRCAIYT